MAHFLVTGGAGFIGSFLCERLIRDHHDVTALDLLSTGRRSNLTAILDQPRFRLLEGSILDESLVQDAVSACDAIFHLASAVGVRVVVEQPVLAIETIVTGTAHILRHAARLGKRVLLTSSSEVYGKTANIPFEEDGDRLEGPTTKPRWAYAAAKALDEFLAFAHAQENGLEVVCVRLFNTVGPRQVGDYGMVLPRFVTAALAHEPLIIHGDGGQSRCFCHVEDVVEGLVGLMNCSAATGEVVNLGTDREITIADLARQVVERLGSRSPTRFVPYEAVYGDRFEDMRRRVPSLEKVSRLIGWRPTRSLETIIDDLAKYHRRTG